MAAELDLALAAIAIPSATLAATWASGRAEA